jgi:hypothetical protein
VINCVLSLVVLYITYIISAMCRRTAMALTDAFRGFYDIPVRVEKLSLGKCAQSD